MVFPHEHENENSMVKEEEKGLQRDSKCIKGYSNENGIFLHTHTHTR